MALNLNQSCYSLRFWEELGSLTKGGIKKKKNPKRKEKKKKPRQSASPRGRRTKNIDRNTIQLMSKKVTPGRFSSHVSQSHESLQG